MNLNVILALTVLLLKTCAENFNLHISSELISNVGTKSISDLGEHEENRAVILSFQQVTALYPPNVGLTMKLAGLPLPKINDWEGEELQAWAVVLQCDNSNVPSAGSVTCAPVRWHRVTSCYFNPFIPAVGLCCIST